MLKAVNVGAVHTHTHTHTHTSSIIEHILKINKNRIKDLNYISRLFYLRI